VTHSKSEVLKFTLAGLVALGVASAQSTNPNGLKNFPFDFALIGDQPYTASVAPGTIEAYQPYINVINDINSFNKVEFTVHVGDIKRGNTLCSDNVYTENVVMFNRFAKPFVYLPGDNEWTDCHRANNGSFNPVERLALIRNTFYPTNQSLGSTTMTLNRQSDQTAAPTAYCPAPPDPLGTLTASELPAGCQFRENVLWTYGVVLFIGLNQPGSNNNRGRTKSIWQDPTDAEFTARNAANMAWLEAGLNLAASDDTIKGVMIMSQANPFERFVEPPSSSNDSQVFARSGYADLIKKLRDHAVSLNKPVIVVNGDTHYFRVDKPLTTTYPACNGATATAWDLNPCVAVAAPTSGNPGRIMNVTRSEVFGDADADWVKVSVDPGDPNLFSFSPQHVKGN
jgi:hypothetical protein